MELSIIIPTFNEKNNIIVLIPKLREVVESIIKRSQYEIIVVDAGSPDGTSELAAELTDRVIIQTAPGYGQALRDGFAAAKGEYVLTMDADLSHSPDFIPDIYRERHNADIIIASRYVAGGQAYMPAVRLLLSKILNAVFKIVLSLPVKDISSGFRLYRADVVKGMKCIGRDFDILPEIIVLSLADGRQILEIPFKYHPRHHGESKARLIKFGISYLTTLGRMWKLRNSIASADYDARAYNSRNPFQRYWQRRRYKIITGWAPDVIKLDIGCGSSRIICDLDKIVGLDIQIGKLRYVSRKCNKPVVNGSLSHLPFPDEAFGCVICSEVIEHVMYNENIFREMYRVLRKGGTLIIGTPDYSSISWIVIEFIYIHVIPGGYADEHITHYTKASLKEILARHGFRFQDEDSILKAELILKFTKP